MDEARELEVIVERVEQRFHHAVPEARLRNVAHAQFVNFRHAAIREFVPVLVERRLRRQVLAGRL
jgi:hypothetical protein